MTKTTDRVALVAGAGGIIGQAVVQELKRQGWTVRALARRSVAGVESINADLTDAERPRQR
jgi:NAD(P)-dependent dehydrogenase (short-subunit alcohol dehydrogenase family)